MKIVCVLGSPRTKGNSAALAQRFCDTAEKLGATTQTFVLNKLNYKGCQGCMGCKTKSDKCVVKDDLAEVLDGVREADVILLTTPVYMGDMTGQLKSFFDRTYSFLVPNFFNNPNPSRLAPGKKLVFIQTQGQPNEKLFADLFPRKELFFKWYGFKESYLIRACGVRNAEDVLAKEEVLKQVEEVAKKVMAQG